MAGTGGARPGAGRRTKAEILGLAKTLEQCITKEEEQEIWKAVKKEALKGNIQHAQLYFGYKYGKPSEHIINETENDTIIRIIRGANDKPENPPSESGESNTGAEAV
jgi:hypothetical protein